MEMLKDNSSPQLVRGNADLTVVVFTDYRCPACRKAHPAFHSAAAKQPNIRIVYRDWPIFGERSERAAKVALAAARQSIYHSVHDALMKSPALDDSSIRAAVERAGGNWQRVEADLLTHGRAMENQINTAKWDAFTLGLQGTPAYLIGPYLVQGALSEGEFTRAFRQGRSKES
jgi:protein-disulfide isomerase